MEEYLKEHGITEETAKKFGLELIGEDIVIPIKDSDGNLLYKKLRYLNYEKRGLKKFHIPAGNEVTLFNTEILKTNDTVYLTEGEMDAIKLTQEGLPAISGTGGLGTFKEEWGEILKGKDVIICYDSDKEDFEGVDKVLKVLKKAKVCYLPKETKDVSVYFQSHLKEDFLKIPLIEKLTDIPPYKEGLVLTSVNFAPVWLKDLEATLEETDWIWEGFLAKGHLTLFSALWKSGKSTLIAHVLKAMQEQEELAGMLIKKSRVLIVSEESKTLWVIRREEMDLKTEVAILPRPLKQRLKYPEWVNFLDLISNFCLEQSIDVVIFDTISGFWSVNNENDASEMGSALLPINNMLEKTNVAIMLIHHFRKSGGDEATASRGSGALGAAVDIIMDFTRVKEEPNSGKRLLKSYSRFKDTPTEVVIELNNGFYETLGDRNQVRSDTKDRILLQAIKDVPNGATTSDIYENWDEDTLGTTSLLKIQRRIRKLLANEKIIVVGEKLIGKSKTKIYKLTDIKHSPPLIGMTSVNEANGQTELTPVIEPEPFDAVGELDKLL